MPTTVKLVICFCFSTIIGLALTAGGCATAKQCKSQTPCPSQQAQQPSEPMVVSFAKQLAQTENTPELSGQPHSMVSNRNWPQSRAQYKHVGVVHQSLYVRDPYEKCGSNDQISTTWDRDSLVSAIASPFIFVGKIVMIPVEAVFNPPWKTQVDRGDYPVQTQTYELSGETSGMAAKNQWSVPFEEDTILCGETQIKTTTEE